MARHPDEAPDQPWIAAARADLGVKEKSGAKHNEKKIIEYYALAGFPEVDRDEVAWCAAFANAKLKITGYPTTGTLLARSFERYGKALSEPKIGCIAVFPRGNSAWQGHVGFVVGITATTVKILGGNQRDMVSIVTYKRAQALAWRWPVKPTVQDLREAGSKDIEASDVLLKTGVGVSGVTGVAKAVNETQAPVAPTVHIPPTPEPTTLESAKTAAEHMSVYRQITEGANEVSNLIAGNIWALAVAAGVIMVVMAFSIRKTRTKRAERGDPLSADIPEGG